MPNLHLTNQGEKLHILINPYTSRIQANLLAPHLVLILPLIDLQIVSFSSFEATGNLLNTSVFKEFSLTLSRHAFLCVPFVLLFASSSFVKK